MKRLEKDFYYDTAVEIAPKLLGKLLCRERDGEILKCRITETECYFGEGDTACHAHKGLTKRTKIMYERGGYAYIYLCYGIHALLNVVTGIQGHPEAVLIRGIENYNGPGKLTKALSITTALNEEDLVASDRIWLEEDGTILEYETTPRIGIHYASEEDKNRYWRFVAKQQETKGK